MIGNTTSNSVPSRRQQVLVEFLQDTSGSMNERRGQWAEYASGFKAFIEDLQAKEDDTVEYFVSLTTFNTVVISKFKAVPVKKVNASFLTTFIPGGGTSLYDAMSATIDGVDKLGREFDKVIMIIVTDGEENTSQFSTKDSVLTLVSSKLDTNRWTFQYLGAQPETWDDAQKIGLARGSTVQFNQQNVGSTYTLMSSAVDNFSKSAFTATSNLGSRYAGGAALASANLCSVVDDGTEDKIADGSGRVTASGVVRPIPE